MSGYPRGVVRGWHIGFRVLYRALRLVDPLIRAWYLAFGLGNIVEIRVRSRRSGRMRSVLVGLLRANDEFYVGHPNGDAAWTADLRSAGTGIIAPRRMPDMEFRPVPLRDDTEREAVVRATVQHVFPGNVIYRLARGHVRAAGVYFRLEPLDPDTPSFTLGTRA